ncbi:unnamed protein product, partial [Mesorhabditis belari]|uniref:Phosphoinositide phospholipase C n=1 Tax=Mesorhabditis belari TaxID=2138241 RepID=A0AAF3EJG0_9BILA
MRKGTLSSVSGSSGYHSHHSSISSKASRSTYARQNELDLEKTYHAMEKGHKVCKLNLMRKWDPAYKKLQLSRETRQLILTKLESMALRNKPSVLDLRSVKEVQTLDFKLNNIKVGDKWIRDKEIRNFEPTKILVIQHGSGFNLSYWILLFETSEACRLWNQGVHTLIMDTQQANHPLVIERWLRKQFSNLLTSGQEKVAMKHMKPFVQTSLQYKVTSRALQEITEEQMTFEVFSRAAKTLIHLQTTFTSEFGKLTDEGSTVSFANFLTFLREYQNDEMANNRERASAFLREYLHDTDITGKGMPLAHTPSLSVMEFCDFLYSRENSLWDSMNEKVVHDMNRPLSHYWIASSHNTYLTGDQLRSESSLDSYARALLMGCRCIELDCWDGTKKPNSAEFLDIVIYHGYTMTSKLLLKDVLQTIRHYAFINSEYPVILSIEDNCSVPAQRLLAQEVREILGDLLLTQPVSRDELELPSPAALKRKIILKHKKLAVESEDVVKSDEFQDTDLLISEGSIKKGLLWLQDSVTHEWTSHIFVLFSDKLCYKIEQCTELNEATLAREDSISVLGDDEQGEDNLVGLGMRPEEMHVTEEWFHGRADRHAAEARLLEASSRGDGVFLVRESTTFLGDYSLSFLYGSKVHHVRIKTQMQQGEKKYYFLDNKVMDTLYELISYYTENPLVTPNFKTKLSTPCPQPQPHLSMPWYSATADKRKAEELLNYVKEDGAYLIRHSSSDHQVFVLSLRVDGEFWHYRLKRDGRIFIVNQMVFENLCQIVEYYSNKDFVRGICLKFPVNERDIGQYASMEQGEAASGCYMDLKDLDKEVQARALRPYKAVRDDELSFPVNAIITVLRKEENFWRGRYGATTGWFPPAYVQEILPQKNQKENGGESQYATIELAGTIVTKIPHGESERPYSMRIQQAGDHWSGQSWCLAANSLEDADDWQNQLWELTRSVNDKISLLRTKEKTARIASELSNLVVYCQAVPFNPERVGHGNFWEMCSFVEAKLEKLLEKGLITFNIRQITRVYPLGSRITSANFNPVPMWNAACHMVALNYQTGDRPMQLNQGKFLANGQCGYVLKPAYMIDPNYDPLQAEKVQTSSPISLSVTVVGGRHLSRKDKNKGICSPYVEVEVVGLDCDNATFKTRTATSNGLNPIWKETFDFNVHCPEVALLRFLVEDGDFVGPKTDPFIGQAVFPLDSIRTGYRSVPLRNQFSEDLELSSLLVLVKITPQGDPGKTISSAHEILQANRSVFAGARTPSRAISNAKSTSLSHERSFPSMDAPNIPQSPLTPVTPPAFVNARKATFTTESITRSESMDSNESDSHAIPPDRKNSGNSKEGKPKGRRLLRFFKSK